MTLLEENKRTLKKIKNRKYWIFFEKAINSFIKKYKKRYRENTLKLIGNHIREIMESCTEVVTRQAEREGLDVAQVRKTVGGNYFQALIAYLLIQNLGDKFLVLINPKLENIKELKSLIINVGNEKSTPDSDIVVYNPNSSESPIFLFSIKTSLRERIAQSVMWKLMVDMASTTCPHIKNIKDCPINKNKISANIKRKVIYSFITLDLYNEISQPQQRGHLRYFDKVFVCKKDFRKRNNLYPFIEIYDTIINLSSK